MDSKRHPKKYYIICYDVEQNKKRTRLAKWLSDYGIRVQKSVFEAYLDSGNLEKLMAGVKELIDENDSFRIYGLSKSSYQQKVTYGKEMDYHPDKDVIL